MVSFLRKNAFWLVGAFNITETYALLDLRHTNYSYDILFCYSYPIANTTLLRSMKITTQRLLVKK